LPGVGSATHGRQFIVVGGIDDLELLGVKCRIGTDESLPK